jgi:hypothetical protein
MIDAVALYLHVKRIQTVIILSAVLQQYNGNLLRHLTNIVTDV